MANFVNQRAALDPEACYPLLGSLAVLQHTHPDEFELCEVWAATVMTFIADRAAEDPQGCQALLEALAASHKAHPEEPVNASFGQAA